MRRWRRPGHRYSPVPRRAACTRDLWAANAAKGGAMNRPKVLPYLKWVNGYQLVVMGVALPISPAQAKAVFSQLQRLEVGHG